MSWTDERVESLKKLWAEGLSANRIAAELGDVSRNAVIGKVHRLGLSGRAKHQPQPNIPTGTQKPRKPHSPAVEFRNPVTIATGVPTITREAEAVAAPAATEEDLSPVLAQFPGAITLMTLTDTTCRWPVGEPSKADFHFCGSRSTPGLPYCGHHARIAYQPVRADRRHDLRLAYI